jgi:nanoRNase/pAp phosphatase (c-di-AMP/oligoRNAs hydrolase)
MVSRLVLGSGTVDGETIAELTDWSGPFRVVSEDRPRVEALRGDDVATTVADPSDPEVLAEFAPVDVVVVVQDAPDAATTTARAAREAFPDATIIAYADVDMPREAVQWLSVTADRVIDARSTIGSTVADLVASHGGVQTRRLRRTLRTIEGQLAIVTHDNPDPDAIASAVALAEIARAVGIEAVPCYYGSINHQENRALVNLLDLELRRLEPGEDLSSFGGFALVDHSRPGVNDQLPSDLAIDVVIDHHPPRAPVEATFVDLRGEVGATSTLLTDYLGRFGFDQMGGEQVATALLYGIRIDTNDFSREVSRADFEAAAALLPHADVGTLERVESPAVSADTFATLARAIQNRQVEGTVVASCVGGVNDRDALAQAAAHLLNMEDVTTTLVYGYDDETVYASARARGTSLDLGETLRVAFDDLGSAGGHADMAGAQIPLANVLARAPGGDRWLGADERPSGTDGVSGEFHLEPSAAASPDGNGADSPDVDGGDRLEDVVEGVVSATFFEAVRDHPHEVPEGIELPSGDGIETEHVPVEWDLTPEED